MMKNERGEGKRKGDRGKVIKGGARDKQEKQEEARQRKTERRRKGEESGRKKIYFVLQLPLNRDVREYTANLLSKRNILFYS